MAVCYTVVNSADRNTGGSAWEERKVLTPSLEGLEIQLNFLTNSTEQISASELSLS
jgi:hypothetical protein